jgi:O-antigen/teichoic acid export membrane protein
LTNARPVPDTDGGVAPTVAGAAHTVVAQLVARIATVLATTGSVAIVARQTGAEYADWGTIVSLVVLLAFALDPGITPIVVRRITQDPRTTPLPRALVPVRLVAAAIAFALLIGIAVAVRGAHAALLAVALGGQLLPRALVLNAMPWLQVDQRLHRMAVLEAVCAAGGLLVLALAAALGAGTPVLALAGFTIPVSLLAIAMARELRITPSRRLDVPGPQRERVLSLLREAGPLALALLITAAYTRTFVVFVNASDDSDLVRSNFLFAFNFVEQLLIFSGIAAGAVLPLLAVRARTSDLLSDEITHRLLVAVATAGALTAAAVIVIADPLTLLIGGPDQRGAGRFLTLLAPMSALLLPAMVLGFVYVAIGRSARYLRYTLIGLAFNLTANALLTLPHGAPASARIVWGTEAAVLVMPLAAIVATGSRGRAAAARMAVVFVAVAVSAELVAGHGLPPVAGGALSALVALAAGGQALWWLTESVGVGPRLRALRLRADRRPPAP